MNDLRNYFMESQQVDGVGNIYPINISEYDEFKKLANTYILLDVPKLNNLRKQNKEPKLKVDHLYDYILDLAKSSTLSGDMCELLKVFDGMNEEEIKVALKINPELQSVFDNIELIRSLSSKNDLERILRLMELTVKNKVVFNNDVFDIVNDENSVIGVINKDNFYEYRRVIMEQNLIFEPRIASNKKSQEILDKAFEKKFSGGESSLETIVAMVCTELSLRDIKDYTYYRLMADYRVVVNKLSFLSSTIYRANGCKGKGETDIEIPSLSANLGLLENPYEDILQKSKATELDKRLGMK